MAGIVRLPDGREFPEFDGNPLSWDPGSYFTPREQELGYPRTKAVLAAMRAHRPEQFERERSDALRGIFGVFSGNARRFLDLIEEVARSVSESLPPADREPCEFCGKPIATDEDGEMHRDDPRLALLCHARSEHGDICPVEQKRLDRIAAQIEASWDRGHDDPEAPR